MGGCYSVAPEHGPRIAAVGTPRQQGDNSPKRDENR